MEWLVSHLVDLRRDTALEVLAAMVHLTKRKALGIAEAITTRLLCRCGPPCRRTSNVQLGRCSMFPHSSYPHCSSFTPIEWAVCRNPSTASSFSLAKSERPFWTYGRWSQEPPPQNRPMSRKFSSASSTYCDNGTFGASWCGSIGTVSPAQNSLVTEVTTGYHSTSHHI